MKGNVDPALVTHRARVVVDAAIRTPLRRIWRYVGYDEPNYTYTESGKELLGKLGRMSDAPYFVRAHFLLCSGDGIGRPKWGSTNVYTEDADGNPVYEWAIIDRIFDTILETGCVPFVELGFTPEAMTTAPDGTPYDHIHDGGWRYPPRDNRRWRDLIRELAAHCRDRYGRREVEQWYWELWNEPDIFYWAGTVEEYCSLYDHTVAGMEAALPRARIGGPATTNPGSLKGGEFLRRFLEHCQRGTNDATGEIGTRIDFVSFHTKGASLRRDPGAPKQTPTIGMLVGHAAAGLEILSAFPELRGCEVILSECDPDGWAAGTIHDNPNLNYRNTEYYASYLAESVCQMIDLGESGPNRIDGMLTWAFEFEDRNYFEGLRTLSTNGIDKPVLNVFRLLSTLGGARLDLTAEAESTLSTDPAVDSAASSPRISGVAAIDGSEKVSILLVSHHDDWDVSDASEVRLEVTGLQTNRAYGVRCLRIDRDHGNSYTAWLATGAPQTIAPEGLELLKRAAELSPVQLTTLIARDGRAELVVEVATHSVCLIELIPE